jgi:V8-like Glu-specific endopeptidase
VAKCTSFLLIDEEKVEGYPKQQFYGTAFFVSDNLLITAGHNTVGVNGPINRLAITYPGIDQIHPWHVSQKEVPTINCKVVASIYKKNGPPSKDIAILDAGSFCAAKYVQLSSFIPPPKTAVYVIGYPGDIKRGWVETQVGLNNLEEAHENATQLFPKGRLTVSCGEVVTTGNIIEYAVSTCPGMSGACVVYNGMVIGN